MAAEDKGRRMYSLGDIRFAEFAGKGKGASEGTRINLHVGYAPHHPQVSSPDVPHAFLRSTKSAFIDAFVMRIVGFEFFIRFPDAAVKRHCWIQFLHLTIDTK